MHTMRKFFSPWKALVAAIAVFASAGSAQAGLSLYFVSSTGPVNIGTVVDGSTGSFTAGDFTGTYEITSTLTAAGPGAPGGALAVRTLSIEITAKNNSTTTAQTLSAFLTGTSLTGPGNGAGFLVAGIDVGTTAGVSTPGNPASFSSTAFYGSSLATTGSVTSTTFSSPTAITISNPYTLVNYSVESTIAAQGSFTVTGSSQVYGVPEPSGIAAALAGVPCLGLLLGTIRRRLTGNSAPAI